VTKTKKYNIETEFSALKLKFEEQKKFLPLESIFLFESLFSLFRVLIAAIAPKTTSKNSDTAPSKDPFREKTKRTSGIPIGGKIGHKGKSLKQVPKPNKVVLHPAISCDGCHKNLKDIIPSEISKHQVFDVEINVIVTEHQVEQKLCTCGHWQSGTLPAGVSKVPCQYGASVKSLAVELTHAQFIPLNRVNKFLESKFNLSVSERSVENFTNECFDKLESWENSAKENLKNSELLHGDETGININGGKGWIHSLSNNEVVLMFPHQRRGTEAMDEIGILGNYHGILCHDFWSAYSAYDVIHACCHAHLKREFSKANEKFDQKWAIKMRELLLGANELRKAQLGILSWGQISVIESRYTRILKQAEIECPTNKKREHQRGKIGQSYPRQLLNRLKARRSWVLLFLYDPRIPFTNNQAERDIRMTKVQQKVSGCFRTFEGARKFCRIRSFILSMQRQGKNPHKELEMILRGT